MNAKKLLLAASVMMVMSNVSVGGVLTSSFTGGEVVLDHGRIYGFGVPFLGYMGPDDRYNTTVMYQDDRISINAPVELGMVNVRKLQLVASVNVAIKENGTAWYWGCKQFGTNTSDCSTPKVIPAINVIDITGENLGRVDFISAGPDGKSGRIYHWDLDNATAPVLSFTNDNVVQLVDNHYFLTNNGLVHRRVVEHGVEVEHIIPGLDHVAKIASVAGTYFAIHTDGEVSVFGKKDFTGYNPQPWSWALDTSNNFPPTKLPEFSDIVNIGGVELDAGNSGGNGGVYFVHSDGSLTISYAGGDYTHVVPTQPVVDVNFNYLDDPSVYAQTSDGSVYQLFTNGSLGSKLGSPTKVLWNDPEADPASLAIYCASTPATDITYFPMCAPTSSVAVSNYIQAWANQQAAEARQRQEIQDNADNLGKLSTMVPGLQQQVADLQAQNTTATNQNTSLQAQATSLQAQVAQLTSQLASVTAERDALQAGLNTQSLVVNPAVAASKDAKVKAALAGITGATNTYNKAIGTYNKARTTFATAKAKFDKAISDAVAAGKLILK